MGVDQSKDIVIGNVRISKENLAFNVYRQIAAGDGTTGEPPHLVLMVSQYEDLNPADRFDQLLSTAGDGTGTTNMATAGTSYTIISAASTVTYIRRLLFQISDDSIRMNRFAGEAELTSGITFTTLNTAGTIIHTFNEKPITTLGEFSLLGGVDNLYEPSAGDDTWHMRWTINKAGEDLMLEPGQSFVMDIPDNLSGLTEFFGNAQGKKRDA